MNNMLLKIILVSGFISLSACSSSPKTEADHYAKMQNGSVYKAYQKISIKAMRPVVKEYNRKLAKQDKAQNAETHVHSFLALVWFASAQPRFALAESDYALSHASDPRDKYGALALQALALHEQGWYQLARRKSGEASALIKSNNFSNSYSNVLALVHVSGAALAIMDKDIPHTISAVRETGVVLDEDWLVQVSDSTQDMYTGAQTSAINKLEKLRNSPDLSDKQRRNVDRVLQAAKSDASDASFNMAKMVAEIAMDQTVDSNSIKSAVLKELPEKYRNKVSKHLE